MGILSPLAAYVVAIPKRYIIVIMTFLSIVSIQTMGNSLPLTITQMVKPNLFAEEKSELLLDTCPMPKQHQINGSSDGKVEYSERFEWSEELQGIILGSYYIGSVIFQVPGAMLAGRIGGKTVITSALCITVVITLVSPALVTAGGAYALIATRILIGCFHGGMFPAVSTILSAWIPACERGLLASIVFCGLPFGSIIGNFVSGLLLDYYRNWHIVFYTFGIAGAIITILFICLCSNNPNTHPFITDAEKNFLRKEMGQLDLKESPPTPWKAILTSRPVLALMVDMMLGDWVYFVVMIDLPKYMNDVLHVSIKDNGIYSSLPWLFRIVVSFTVGYWSDWLISTGRLSITNTRKLYVFLGSTIDAIFLLAAAYAGCNELLVGAFFTIAVGSQGFFATSSLLNPMDLSPNFSGIITGLSNGVGCMAGVAVPWVIGILTPNSLQSEWRIVFWLSVSFEILKIINFALFGSGEVQPWNSSKPKDDAEAKTEEIAHTAN